MVRSQTDPGARLAAELRRIKTSSGVSLRRLVRVAHVSDSALSRYLSGQVVPPWPVVEALCRFGARDPAELRALWEQASQTVRRGRPPGSRNGAGPDVAGLVTIRGLPSDLSDFTGRAEELSQLLGEQPASSAGPRIVAIDGMAGIGKTALAVHVGHRLSRRYPDGQLFIDLRAHTAGQEPLEPSAALDLLLRQIGIPPERIPAGFRERSALWRSEIAGRKTVIVMDNAAGTDQVAPLLPGGSDSLVLITGRRRLVDLDGVQVLSLDVLPTADAVGLFAAIAADRASAEPEAVLEVVRLCGNLPLAVRIAAARLRHRPSWTVEYLAGRLGEQAGRLAELSTGERSVAAAFEVSYQQLDAGQQRMLRLLAVHPGSDTDVFAAAALADTSAERAEMLLEELLDANVLLQHRIGRYTLHDLLREHARCAGAADRDALARLLGYYEYTAKTAVDLIHPESSRRRPLIAEPTTPTVPLTDATTARAWLDTERANLVAAGCHAADHGLPSAAIRLAAILERYLEIHTAYDDAIALQTTALTASRLLGDQEAQARVLSDLAWAHWRLDHHDQAAEYGREALAISCRAGDLLGQARAHNRLGGISYLRGDYTSAHDHFRQEAELGRATGDELSLAASLANIGLALEALGHYDEALEHHYQALHLNRAAGRAIAEAVALENIGTVYIAQGHHDRAREHLTSSLDLSRKLGYRRGEAGALNSLGELARAAGDPVDATALHEAARTMAGELGSRWLRARADHGLARARRDRGHSHAAHEHARAALEFYSELGHPEADDVRALLDELRAAPGSDG